MQHARILTAVIGLTICASNAVAMPATGTVVASVTPSPAKTQLPGWFAGETDTERLGAGVPSMEPLQARTSALFNAVLAYVRGTSLGRLDAISSRSVGSQPDSCADASSAVKSEGSETITYHGFTCDVLNESRTQQGEHFIRCRFAPEGRADNMLIVQRQWSYERTSVTRSKREASVKAMFRINGQSHQLEFTVREDASGQQAMWLWVNDKPATLPAGWSYSRSTTGTAPTGRPVALGSGDLAASLGLAQTALYCLVPFVPASAKTNSLRQGIRDSVALTGTAIDRCTSDMLGALYADTLSMPVDIRLGGMDRQGMTATVANVAFDDDASAADGFLMAHSVGLDVTAADNAIHRLLMAQEQYYTALWDVVMQKEAIVLEQTPPAESITVITGQQAHSEAIVSADISDIGVRWDFEPLPDQRTQDRLTRQALKQGRFMYPRGLFVRGH